MEITWYGHSCFRITERGLATVVTDPYDHRQVGYDPLKLKADIVTISHNSPGHNNLAAIKGNPYRITGPGEFEVGGVFITGVQTNGHKSADELRNTLYLIDYNGITVVHLGDMNRVPTQTEVEALGNVNVLLVPVASGGGFNVSKAIEVISVFEPNIVIPMHYATEGATVKLEPLNRFLKELGQTEVKPQPSLKVATVGSLPEETQVVVLDYQRS